MPFFVLHGEADTVTDPEVSRALTSAQLAPTRPSSSTRGCGMVSPLASLMRMWSWCSLTFLRGSTSAVAIGNLKNGSELHQSLRKAPMSPAAMARRVGCQIRHTVSCLSMAAASSAGSVVNQTSSIVRCRYPEQYVHDSAA